MPSLNKVMLIGHLGRDPEVKNLPSGDVQVTFSLATSESWKDKSGAKQERTEWHNIVMYRRLAEIAADYLRKGRAVYVEGRIQTRKWQDKDGRDRFTTEIVASEMKMLGGGKGEDTAPAPAKAAPATGGSIADMENDIPF